MPRPYSQDLRERIVRAVEGGLSRNAAAKRFDVSISFVVKLMQRWSTRGTLAPDQFGGWKKATLAAHQERVLALVGERCDATLDELRTLLATEGLTVSLSALSRFLRAHGVTRKKRPRMPPNRSAPTSPRPAPLGGTSNPS